MLSRYKTGELIIDLCPNLTPTALNFFWLSFVLDLNDQEEIFIDPLKPLQRTFQTYFLLLWSLNFFCPVCAMSFSLARCQFTVCSMFYYRQLSVKSIMLSTMICTLILERNFPVFVNDLSEVARSSREGQRFESGSKVQKCIKLFLDTRKSCPFLKRIVFCWV